MPCVSLTSRSLVVSPVGELGLAGAGPGLTSAWAVLPHPAVVWRWDSGWAHGGTDTIGVQPGKPLERSRGCCCWKVLCNADVLKPNRT